MSAAELRHHLDRLGSGQVRIEQRLIAIEMGLRIPPTGRPSGLSPAQCLKILAGLALPLAALLLAAAGNFEAARRLLAP
jgi:hypothetical protein